MFQNIASIAAVFGIFIAVLAVRAARLQRRRQFETIFVQRYWSLIDRLSLDAQKGHRRPQIEGSDEKTVRSYLRLCEDELKLRKEGWISDETWQIWQIGMVAQLRRWPFDVIWTEVNKQTGPERTDRSVPEEFQLLRQFLEDEKDPKTLRPRWKRFARGPLRGFP
jgi:hypothetical protein